MRIRREREGERKEMKNNTDGNEVMCQWDAAVLWFVTNVSFKSKTANPNRISVLYLQNGYVNSLHFATLISLLLLLLFFFASPVHLIIGCARRVRASVCAIDERLFSYLYLSLKMIIFGQQSPCVVFVLHIICSMHIAGAGDAGEVNCSEIDWSSGGRRLNKLQIKWKNLQNAQVSGGRLNQNEEEKKKKSKKKKKKRKEKKRRSDLIHTYYNMRMHRNTVSQFHRRV